MVVFEVILLRWLQIFERAWVSVVLKVEEACWILEDEDVEAWVLAADSAPGGMQAAA